MSLKFVVWERVNTISSQQLTHDRSYVYVHNTVVQCDSVTPPNNPVCSYPEDEGFWEKSRMAVKSIFSFSHRVFNYFKTRNQLLS